MTRAGGIGPRAAGDWGAAPCGLITTAVDGTIVDVNATMLEWLGRSRSDLLEDVDFSALLTVGGRIYWETHLAPVLAVEGRVDEVLLELRTADGRVPVVVTALRDETGLTRIAVLVARERARFDRELLAANSVSEKAVAQLAALLHVTAAVANAAGVDAVVTALVDSVREHLGAGEVGLWLNAPDGNVPSGVRTPVARPDDEGPAGAVGNGRDAVLHGGVVLVPAWGHSRLRAVLTLSFPTGPAARRPDLVTLTTVGLQAGLALDRAWQDEQRATIAHELQRSLLATDPPADSRFDVAAVYRPGVESLDVGGDWYDVSFTDADTRTCVSLTIGDVVGRGLKAAVAMGQLRSAVRALTAPGAGPGRVLGGLDRFVDQFEDARCATVVLGQLDLDTGDFSYACAGHLPPVLVPATGDPRLLWGGRSTPLGVVADSLSRDEANLRLNPGDAVLLYTDGLVERRHRSLDGGLDALVAAAGDDGPSLQDRIDHLTRRLLVDEDSRDDVCLLLVRWNGPDPTR